MSQDHTHAPTTREFVPTDHGDAEEWDPVHGCIDPRVAQQRADGLAAGTLLGVARRVGMATARFYAAEAAKVLAAYFHAAGLAGGTLTDVLGWAGDPLATRDPETILRDHPDAAPLSAGLLTGVLRGDEHTSAHTITVVQLALTGFLRSQTGDRAASTPAERPGALIPWGVGCPRSPSDPRYAG